MGVQLAERRWQGIPQKFSEKRIRVHLPVDLDSARSYPHHHGPGIGFESAAPATCVLGPEMRTTGVSPGVGSQVVAAAVVAAAVVVAAAAAGVVEEACCWIRPGEKLDIIVYCERRSPMAGWVGGGSCGDRKAGRKARSGRRRGGGSLGERGRVGCAEGGGGGGGGGGDGVWGRSCGGGSETRTRRAVADPSPCLLELSNNSLLFILLFIYLLSFFSFYFANHLATTVLPRTCSWRCLARRPQCPPAAPASRLHVSPLPPSPFHPSTAQPAPRRPNGNQLMGSSAHRQWQSALVRVTISRDRLSVCPSSSPQLE